MARPMIRRCAGRGKVGDGICSVGGRGRIIRRAKLAYRRRATMADHITFFRMKTQPGKRQAVIDHFAQDEESTRESKGFVRAIVVISNDDPDELMAGGRFDSAENYNANSNDPQTGAWSQGVRAMLAADPDWFNGTLARELIR